MMMEALADIDSCGFHTIHRNVFAEPCQQGIRNIPFFRPCLVLVRAGGYHTLMFRTAELLYPVVSRRSGGVSLGIDLFPDAKTCNFDCPYCEIFPFSGTPVFRLSQLERELEEFFRLDYPAYLPDRPLRDIALGGNGEPTLSPYLGDALAAIRRARDRFATGTDLVLITNATTLGKPETAALLGRYVDEAGLLIWAKLDGGNEAAYARMSRSAVPFRELVAGLLSFSRLHPVIVQTMLCVMDGEGPSDEDLEDYSKLLAALLGDGARFREIHLYTQARPSPEGRTSPLSDHELLREAERIAGRIAGIPVRVFGQAGELHR